MDIGMNFARLIGFNRLWGGALGFLLVLSVAVFFWNETLTHWLSGVVVFLGVLWFFIKGRDFRFLYPVLAFYLILFSEVITWLLVTKGSPVLGDGALKLDALAKIFIFLPFGWILYKNKNYVTPLIFFSAFGAALMCVVPAGSFDQLVDFLKLFPHLRGARFEFGYDNSEFLGFFSGFSLMILVFFAKRFYDYFERRRYIFLGLYFIMTLMLFVGLFAAQTRAAFLGLFVVAVFSVLWWFLFLFKNRNEKHVSWLSMLLPLVLLILVSLSFGKVWQDRAVADAPAFKELKQMNFNEVPETSVGMRIYLWQAAVPAILSRPFFGWGHDGSFTSLNQSSIPENVIKNTGHYHNAFLDLLVRQGLVALILILSVYVWISFQLVAAYRRGNVPIDFMMFFFAFVVYFSVTNQFESYLLYTAGAFSSNLVLSLAVYYIFRDRRMLMGE